jgi:hypothetical protein
MSLSEPQSSHDPAAGRRPLSAGDMACYARVGWVACRGLFSRQEVAEIARWTDELVALPQVPGRHMVYYEDSLAVPGERVLQRIEDFCPYHQGFDGLVRGARLLAAAEQLLEGPAVLFKEKINFKKAGGAGFEPHQDQQAARSSSPGSSASIGPRPRTAAWRCPMRRASPARSGRSGRR